MKNITVFCASSDDIDNIYYKEASIIGQWIGNKYKRLIYGGATGGLMEAIAQSAKNNNAGITGVITKRIIEMGRLSSLPDTLITTDTMGERKQKLTELGDIFVILPGGIGTIDELFDVLTTRMLGYHDKPILFCNTGGFYNPLLRQLEQFYKTGFAKETCFTFYEVAGNAEECCRILETYC